MQFQVRWSPRGPAGLDMPACAAIALQAGVPTPIAYALLPFLEAGMMAGFADRRPDA